MSKYDVIHKTESITKPAEQDRATATGNMHAARSTTVHDGLLHPQLRHCSSPASAEWQVAPYHSTRRTVASTPQTLLVASICRVAGNTLPQYMTDCCIHTSDIARRQHLRSAGCHQLFVPRHRRSMFGRRACSVAGPAACNSLPDYLRDPSHVPLTVFAAT